MEPEQLQNFNERLSQWVANQGFWFQVRYSMSGTGLKGKAMLHLLQMVSRLLYFLLALTICFWVYLVKRTESRRYVTSQRVALQESLSASDLEMRNFRRTQGVLEISRLAAEGGGDTFFTSFEAKNIRCNMGLLDGLIGVWKPGIISIARLDLDLRAGADDANSANKMAAALFHKSNKVEVNFLEVGDTTLRWGYSKSTSGRIDSSSMKMQRMGEGWRMSFKGGTFTQNWLHQLDIISLVVDCQPDGMFFEKAEFKQGAGTVDISGLRLKSGERPEVTGIAKIRNLDLDEVLPAALQTFLEGSISGDFKVFGSTNSSDGVGFEGQVVLDGKDSIALRERIPLLRALSVVDFSRNYHRVDFREGSFQLKSSHGGLELTEVKLKADELFTLDGKLKVRLPTHEEIQMALAKGTGLENSPLFSAEDEAMIMEHAKSGSFITLKKAAQAERTLKDKTELADTGSLFDRLTSGVEARRLQEQESVRMSRMLRYEGSFLVTIPPDAFERAPKLKELYPLDHNTGRIPVQVPIDGDLYDITVKQAEDTYQGGQRQ